MDSLPRFGANNTTKVSLSLKLEFLGCPTQQGKGGTGGHSSASLSGGEGRQQGQSQWPQSTAHLRRSTAVKTVCSEMSYPVLIF